MFIRNVHDVAIRLNEVIAES